MNIAIIVIVAVLYIIGVVFTYKLEYTLLISDLDYASEEDRELFNDKLVRTVALVFIAVIWVIYIPYMIVRAIIEEYKSNRV